MKLYKKGFLIFTVFTLAILVGCKSKQTTTRPVALVKKNEREVIVDALKAQLNYRTITTKGSVELIQGKSGQKFSTVFKIIKDSIIQASVRPVLGMEAMRLTFTPDSVFMLDRFKKQYVAENFSHAMKTNNIDFNFYNLQALLTNQLFIIGNESMSEKDYKTFQVTRAPHVYNARAMSRSKLIYNFAIDATDRVTSAYVYNVDKSLNILWLYKNFVIDRDYVYPRTMTAKIVANKEGFEIGISYSNLDIDSELNVDYKIPDKYNKVDFETLMSSYIK